MHGTRISECLQEALITNTLTGLIKSTSWNINLSLWVELIEDTYILWAMTFRSGNGTRAFTLHL